MPNSYDVERTLRKLVDAIVEISAKHRRTLQTYGLDTGGCWGLASQNESAVHTH